MSRCLNKAMKCYPHRKAAPLSILNSDNLQYHRKITLYLK